MRIPARWTVRRLSLMFAVVLLAALAVPVNATSGGNRTEYQEIGYSTEIGNGYAQWNPTGPNYLQVSVHNIYQCDAYGSDIPMPTVKFNGVDRVSYSLSIPQAEFNNCSGTAPEVVTVDIDIEVDDVVRTSRTETVQVLKGDRTPSSTSSQQTVGSAEYREGVVTGILQDSEITGLSTGHFFLLDRNSGGPTTTTLAP